MAFLIDHSSETITRSSDSYGFGNPALTENTTVDFTSTDTLAEMQAFIDAVPKNLGGYVAYFDFDDGTYNSSMTGTDMLFSEFFNGTIYIRGNTGESELHTNQAVVLDFSAGDEGLLLNHNTCDVYISNLAINISDTAGADCIDIVACNYVYISGCYLYGDGKTGSNHSLYVRNNAYCRMSDTYVSNTHRGLFAKAGGRIFSDTNDDTGTAPNYGLVATEWGQIGKLGDVGSDTQPAGSTANELATAPGVIE